MIVVDARGYNNLSPSCTHAQVEGQPYACWLNVSRTYYNEINNEILTY